MNKFLIFLFLLWGICPADISAQKVSGNSPRETVSLYLKALKALDHGRMEKYWAETVVQQGPDGPERKLNKAFIKGMRDFERGVKTVWKYEIKQTEGEQVTVELSEKNDFYDLLGVGTRFQTSIYFVREGRIYRMETRAMRHESGEDFNAVYASFKKWLMGSEAGNDKQLVGDGVLIWNRESAKRMYPWLKLWSKNNKKVAS